MSKSAGVVEINGRRYDSASGDVVGVIDGFVRRKPPARRPKPTVKKTLPIKKTMARPARSVKSSTRVHHRPQHPHTLMRGVVKRPGLRVKESATSAIAKVGTPIARAIDSDRLEKAKAISRHPKIKRFGLSESRTNSSFSAKKPVEKTATVRPLSAAPAATLPQTISHQQLEKMLDKALLSADAHKQALSRRSNRWLRPFGLPRWVSIVLYGIIIVAIGALIAWRSIPAIAIKMGSLRSHVSAKAPAYIPSGFSFSKVQAGNGSLTIKYSAKDAGATYSVIQAPSSWDSQSLKANTLSKESAVQTSEVGGTTVYIFGPSDNAEWVSNGNLYKINNQAHLSSDQIINIVQSL